MSRLPDTIEEIIEHVRRKGGATVIARAIAIREDPESTPLQILGAMHWEATMRERHGDPRPEWLAKEVARQRIAVKEARVALEPFRQEAKLYGVDPDDRRPGEYFTYAEELAIGHYIEATAP